MVDKTEYQEAVDAFERADSAYLALQDFVESGEFLREIFDRSLGNYETAKGLWDQIWDKLRALRDERNVRLVTVKNALRQAVQLGPTQERGPDGASTILKVGEFTVSSVTGRTFDAQTLLVECKKFGVFDELMALKYTDKMGVELPAVMTVPEINYEKVLSWLKAKKLDHIIKVAYEEREKTPAVKGPKEIAFLGEKKGD